MASEKRLIYANVLVDKLQEAVSYKGMGAAIAGILLRYIEEIPTVDAVEVVRCKDCACRRWDGYSYGCVNPKGLRGDLKDSFFCPYGKKKEMANTDPAPVKK